MPVRAPRAFAPAPMTNPLQSALEVEIVAEQAATMGHLGRQLEKAMHRLDLADENEREEALDAVAWSAWSLIVQREVCGVHDHRGVIRHYRVPTQALNRMGAMPTRPGVTPGETPKRPG